MPQAEPIVRIAVLTKQLNAVQKRWFELPRLAQDDLYAREFAEVFAPLFAELPLHGAPPELPRPRALISVLGFSWQPVALMAAWCKPERMLVIGTSDSLGIKVCGEDVLLFVARTAGISRDVVDRRCVGDPGETDIYRAVRDFIRESGFAAREVFVDPTGGKKSMSASAALSGFLAGTPLVYVDYAEYHGANRIPVAGTEYPRLLSNPLEVMGDLELRDIFAAFNRSDFQEAGRLADRLADRVYEPREAQCLAKLACGYGAWDRFDFDSALETLTDARRLINLFADQGNWRWAQTVGAALDGNCKALKALKSTPRQLDHATQGLPLLAWYLASADRLTVAQKPSLAVLLTYAAVERYINLCLWVDFGLDDEKPDYSLVDASLNRPRYHEAGRLLFANRYQERPLDGPLMFANGAQLLAALKPERLSCDDFGPLKGLSQARNKCEFEHGFLPQQPKPESAGKWWSKATEIIGRVAGASELDAWIDRCRFPRLDASGIGGDAIP